jgi:hypothetical protein
LIPRVRPLAILVEPFDSVVWKVDKNLQELTAELRRLKSENHRRIADFRTRIEKTATRLERATGVLRLHVREEEERFVRIRGLRHRSGGRDSRLQAHEKDFLICPRESSSKIWMIWLRISLSHRKISQSKDEMTNLKTTVRKLISRNSMTSVKILTKCIGNVHGIDQLFL